MIRACFVLPVAALALGAPISCAGAAPAHQYPNKNVTLVIPFPPGGSTDLVGRLLAQHLGEAWTQTVVVENRPGGNGMLGPTAVAKSKADGYTLLLAAPTIATAKVTMKVLPIDPMKDLDPISQLIEVPYVISVSSKIEANSLKELTELAKANPGKLNYGWFSNRLTTEYFADSAGIKLTPVGYRGEALMMAALAAGEVQIGLASPVNVAEYQSRGQIKALAVTGERRLDAFKGVPTIGEAGLPEIADAVVWFALFAPAGTPIEIRRKIAADVATFTKSTRVVEKLNEAGFQPKSSSPEELGQYLMRETERAVKIADKIQLEKQ